MQSIKASEFKAKCLALIDEISRTGECLFITKNGRVIAELHPNTGQRPASPFGLHKGKTKVLGDIVGPIDTQERETRL